jgi:hypothetical protein
MEDAGAGEPDVISCVFRYLWKSKDSIEFRTQLTAKLFEVLEADGPASRNTHLPVSNQSIVFPYSRLILSIISAPTSTLPRFTSAT